MKFVKVPKGVGYWGVLFFIFGFVIMFTMFPFILSNVLFSALGVLEFSGGVIILSDLDLWFPFIPQSIESVGRVGLFLAICSGIFASIMQVINHTVPDSALKQGQKTSVDKKDVWVWFMIGITVYDYLSTHYYLGNGSFVRFAIESDWLDGIINGALDLTGLVLLSLLFSVISEMGFIYGMEMVITNWKEGIKGLKELKSSVGEFILHRFGYKDTETESEPEEKSNRGRKPKMENPLMPPEIDRIRRTPETHEVEKPTPRPFTAKPNMPEIPKADQKRKEYEERLRQERMANNGR